MPELKRSGTTIDVTLAGIFKTLKEDMPWKAPISMVVTFSPKERLVKYLLPIKA